MNTASKGEKWSLAIAVVLGRLLKAVERPTGTQQKDSP